MTRTLAETMVETNPGTLLAGKYRVERVLGTGGMGVVVAALHEQLDERVAIKLLRADRIAQKDAVERALREARAAVKIQSDHVVRVFDVATLESGAPYIVMEYLAGCDLAQLLCAEGKLDIADASSYVRQACDAVSKAHALGIVHRDLKPANMFLAVRDDKSSIKVLDFGISKLVSTDGTRANPSLTATANVIGSPAYMSPEQLETPKDIDGRTDVWSLGVILFELLTGAHPFVADTLPQLYKKIVDEPAPSVRSIRPDVPADLDAIVARCLAKKPGDRFADVTSLARSLSPFAVDASDDRKMAALAETAAASREEIESARLASKVSGPAQGESSGVSSSSLAEGKGELAAAPSKALTVDRTRHQKRRRIVWSGAAFAGLAAAAMSTLVCVRADRSHASVHNAAGGSTNASAASPLTAPGSVLACPPLVSKGVEQPSGWFGASAAAIACTRATVRMGDRAERTLLPAELLDLPRSLTDTFPEDAFSSDGARDKAVAAAQQRAQAWIDGTIEKTPDGFVVELILRAGDRELARATGREATLVPAIHDAMVPLDKFIPAVRDDDPFMREWMGARTADAGVLIAEWSIANRLDWPDKSGCDELAKNPDILPVTQKAIATNCTPDIPDLPDRDVNLPGALVTSIEADGKLSERPMDAELARVDQVLASTTDHQARSFLLAAKANILTAHRKYIEATQLALQSVNESPDAFFPWTTGWIILAWTRANSQAAPAAIAWQPWNSEANCFSSMRAATNAQGTMYMRRNTAMSSHWIWKEALTEFLVQGKNIDEARSIASTLPKDPVEAKVDAGEGRFQRAFERLEPFYRSDDPYSATFAAYLAQDFASITGKPVKGVTEVAQRLLDKQPEKLDILTEINLSIACATFPRDAAKHCFKRLRELTGGIVFFDPSFLDGAEAYSQGDYKGAAHAWRSLVARPDWHLMFTHDLVADAFEKAGDSDNAARIDARYLDNGRFNGAEMAQVREALRAEKRGDAKRARELAKRVIDAWSVVDMDIPAVADMRKLVARLDKASTTKAAP